MHGRKSFRRVSCRVVVERKWFVVLSLEGLPIGRFFFLAIKLNVYLTWIYIARGTDNKWCHLNLRQRTTFPPRAIKFNFSLAGHRTFAPPFFVLNFGGEFQVKWLSCWNLNIWTLPLIAPKSLRAHTSSRLWKIYASVNEIIFHVEQETLRTLSMLRIRLGRNCFYSCKRLI